MAFGLTAKQSLYYATYIGIGYGLITAYVKMAYDFHIIGYSVGVVLLSLYSSISTYLLFRYNSVLPFLLFLVFAQRTYFAKFEPSPGEEYIGLLIVTVIAIPIAICIAIIELLVRETFV